MPGRMYDPAVQGALLRTLARWRRLPLGDLLEMLDATDRLKFRPGALADLEWEGLVDIMQVGDEPVVAITTAGERWLREGADG